LRTANLGARAFIPVALIGAVLLSLAPSTAAPASAASPKTEAQQIITIAKQQRGDPWRHGATGPRAFDCSGLVIYAYRKAGDLKTIGKGKLRSARAMYRYFKAHGRADRHNPKPGDLVIWGRGTHVGIYIGNGKAISTLTSGVRIHRVRAVTAKFTAYLHTGMWKRSTAGGSIVQATQKTSLTPRIAIGDARHTTGSVNLRTAAGVTHQRLAVLRARTALVVLAKDQDAGGRWWLKVKAGTRTGWVAKWLTAG
jgi:hypothetical protein